MEILWLTNSPTRSYQHCARTSGTGAAGKSESGKFFSSVSLQRLSLQTICGIGWGGRMDICQGPFKEHQAVLIIIVETFQALESKGRPLLILVTCWIRRVMIVEICEGHLSEHESVFIKQNNDKRVLNVTLGIVNISCMTQCNESDLQQSPFSWEKTCQMSLFQL